MSCARSRPSRHRRHDGLLRIIALAIQRWLKVECSTTERLHSSSASGKKVDLVVTSYDLHPPHTAFDATVSVPLLPSHLASAAKDASILFSDRAKEKILKHLPGCVDLQRSFLPIVWSAPYGGIGPADAREWLNAIFAPAYTTELLAGTSGQQTAHHRRTFFQSLHACLLRSTSSMILHAFTPTAPPPAPAPPAPPAPAPAPDIGNPPPAPPLPAT